MPWIIQRRSRAALKWEHTGAGFNCAQILQHLLLTGQFCDSCWKSVHIYDSFAFLHISGNRLSHNLGAIECRPRFPGLSTAGAPNLRGPKVVLTTFERVGHPLITPTIVDGCLTGNVTCPVKYHSKVMDFLLPNSAEKIVLSSSKSEPVSDEDVCRIE